MSDQCPATRFNTAVSTRLRELATPEEISALRKIIDDAARGHGAWPWWYLSLVVRIIEQLGRR